MKYEIETKHPPALRDWTVTADPAMDIEDARRMVADYIAARLDKEDRGEEYEREWMRLAELAKTAEPCFELEFDDRAWRIVEAREDV